MVTISRAQALDVPEMHSLQQRAFAEEARRLGLQDIPPLLEQAESIAAHVQTQIALVARQDGTTVGCVRGILDGRVCTIRALVVDPAKHGQGIGSKLLRALEAELNGIDRIELVTNPVMDRNVPFYERHGYRVVELSAPRPGVTLAHLSKPARAAG